MVATSTPQPVTLGNINNVAPFIEAVVSFASSGANIAIAGVAGQTIKVYRLVAVVAGATTLTVKSASTALTGVMSLASGGAIVLDNSGVPWFTTAAGEDLVLTNANAVQVSGKISYVQA